MIVTDERVGRFVAERTGSFICPPYTFLGIERGGEVIAGAVFNCFVGSSVEVTVAGKGWDRAFFRAVGDYVFRQMGCCRMGFTTEQETVARLAERLGGVREGVMRSYFGPGRDGIVIGVLADEYKFRS
ncbi:GNAT family N-acetyltransferase [Paracoccus pantotrophus]|uniref:GNAT family N-acetyltransferase n=1 Tax=Paracoccus pantotrophus TaxID=82367 RepID=UPI00048ABE61|nr:hypothetical protein [Paracoccus pantotrophus]